MTSTTTGSKRNSDGEKKTSMATEEPERGRRDFIKVDWKQRNAKKEQADFSLTNINTDTDKKMQFELTDKRIDKQVRKVIGGGGGGGGDKDVVTAVHQVVKSIFDFAKLLGGFLVQPVDELWQSTVLVSREDLIGKVAMVEKLSGAEQIYQVFEKFFVAEVVAGISGTLDDLKILMPIMVTKNIATPFHMCSTPEIKSHFARFVAFKIAGNRVASYKYMGSGSGSGSGSRSATIRPRREAYTQIHFNVINASSNIVKYYLEKYGQQQQQYWV